MKTNDNQGMISEQLSKKAIENMERNDTVRRDDSIFLQLLPGEEITIKFDPEKIELKEFSFAGIKRRRLQYTVVDSKNKKTKYWTVNHKTSAIIDSYLMKGYRELRALRMGSGLQTKYQISAP